MSVRLDATLVDTSSGRYTERLLRREAVWWKRYIDVQTPYRWNIKRLKLGFVLDVGCGLGRNLLHLEGHGVGVDHNATTVEVARRRGLTVFTPAEFEASTYARPGSFDSLLYAHVAEHMTLTEFKLLLVQYLPYARSDAKVVIVTPQEKGFASDTSHREFVDFLAVRHVARHLHLKVERQYSFPLPRPFGKAFRYNEFVSVLRAATAA